MTQLCSNMYVPIQSSPFGEKHTQLNNAAVVQKRFIYHTRKYFQLFNYFLPPLKPAEFFHVISFLTCLGASDLWPLLDRRFTLTQDIKIMNHSFEGKPREVPRQDRAVAALLNCIYVQPHNTNLKAGGRKERKWG